MAITRSIYVVRTQRISCDIRNDMCCGQKVVVFPAFFSNKRRKVITLSMKGMRVGVNLSYEGNVNIISDIILFGGLHTCLSVVLLLFPFDSKTDFN